MTFNIIAVKEINNGRLFEIDSKGLKLQLLFTWHSLDRIAFWSLEVENILETILFPDEVVTGHFDRYIAHKRNNGHVIRVVYEYNEKIPVIVTVYNPSADRYF